MYRGTTPRITFKFKNEIDLTAFDQIWVTFKMVSGTKDIQLDFEIEDLIIDNENQKIMLDLTQEQTLQLKRSCDLKAQIRFYIETTEKSYSTNIVTLSVNDILRDGVIS